MTDPELKTKLWEIVASLAVDDGLHGRNFQIKTLLDSPDADERVLLQSGQWITPLAQAIETELGQSSEIQKLALKPQEQMKTCELIATAPRVADFIDTPLDKLVTR